MSTTGQKELGQRGTESLKERLAAGRGKVAVLGVGYVGLPLAVMLAKDEGGRNFSVVGVDILKDRIEQLKEGKSPIEGVEDEDVKAAVKSGRLKPLHVFDSDPKAPDPRPSPDTIRPLVGADVFVICVPTPLDPEEQWKPDMRWIEKAAKLLGHVCDLEAEEKSLPPERLIVLESTSYPGTTKEYFGEFVEKYTDGGGRRWYLAYSPERTNPGLKNPHEADPSEPVDMSDIKRVVGGLDVPDREHAEALYKNIFRKVVPVASLEAAEMVKLVENTFRFIVIGFANEMSRVTRSFDLNVWDIISAVKTKGFGLNICYPGLIGGHCIPIDPQYLNWAFRNQRQIAAFIDMAEKAHQEMKRDALELIQRLLNQNNRGIAGSTILFLGVAYKKNVADTRESAALELMKKLYSSGADVYFWDPVRAKHPEKPPVHLEFSREEYKHLPPKKQTEEFEDKGGRYHLELHGRPGKWEDLREEILSTKYDCVVISTDHDDFQDIYEELLTADVPRPLADLRNAIENWLSQSMSDGRITEEKASELRQKLAERSKYMLLGVH